MFVLRVNALLLLLLRSDLKTDAGLMTTTLLIFILLWRQSSDDAGPSEGPDFSPDLTPGTGPSDVFSLGLFLIIVLWLVLFSGAVVSIWNLVFGSALKKINPQNCIKWIHAAVQ